ncbi:aminoglycoside phosphotransferase [Grosmannia clavigera kw1407]|uniref:Aminoglycoside phosphotransferase n=1 Tax=Grosmannia clavigera (strain kw1407 / UAMH 11150) TaxID=655863 RepID=F0X9X7_GROCL|nr:aminoglycoside phosphotransferase [Grosmannia clavigera kw1407]EFX05248.1 aminoglycoside phosphotransferase [Grosmannia clavigera kw1407]
MGRPVSPERSQILDAEITEEAAVIVYQTPRKVISVLENGIAKKWTRGDSQLHEMEALRVAKECGLLVPDVRGYGTTPAGKIWLAMDKIAGQPLEQVWKDLSKTKKTAIAQQLGAFMAQKRAMPPPEGHIGGPRAGQPGREIRQYHDYEIPACRDESEFNKYLLGALLWNTPVPFRNAFAECLRADHRIVYTHADFALRNIMVQDGQVTGVLDWENAGWFPEYWEYVKFFHQNFGNNDFRDYADIIFPRSFPNELITYTALLKYQYP